MYNSFVLSLDPTFYAPLDVKDFDDKFAELVSFSDSDATSAVVVRESVLPGMESSADSSSSVINFPLATTGTLSAAFAVKPTDGQSASLMTTNDDSVSVNSLVASLNTWNSPALTEGVWSFLVVVNDDWTVVELGESELDSVLVGGVTLFDRQLSAQEVADLVSVVDNHYVVRSASSGIIINIADDETTGIKGDWHTIKV